MYMHIESHPPSNTVISVEPLNKGYVGASHVVLCREVVLFSKVQNVLVLWEWYLKSACPLQIGCPFLRGSLYCANMIHKFLSAWSEVLSCMIK